jgi:hypothetical protein
MLIPTRTMDARTQPTVRCVLARRSVVIGFSEFW